LCYVRGTSRKYALDMLVLLSLWLVKAGIDLTQIEAMVLKEANFLFLEKPNVLLSIRLETTILHPWTNLPQVPFKISLAMVLLFMFISHWIQMLGPKQGMGRRFVILTRSNYPFCKKTSGMWDELLKPHY